MKTIIAASALMLTTSVAFAAQFEDQYQSPDLGTGVYDKPLTLTEPAPSSSKTMVSLDTFNKGNPDHSSHAPSNGMGTVSTEGYATSLDQFNEGNPDHV